MRGELPDRIPAEEVLLPTVAAPGRRRSCCRPYLLLPLRSALRLPSAVAPTSCARSGVPSERPIQDPSRFRLLLSVRRPRPEGHFPSRPWAGPCRGETGTGFKEKSVPSCLRSRNSSKVRKLEPVADLDFCGPFGLISDELGPGGWIELAVFLHMALRLRLHRRLGSRQCTRRPRRSNSFHRRLRAACSRVFGESALPVLSFLLLARFPLRARFKAVGNGGVALDEADIESGGVPIRAWE